MEVEILFAFYATLKRAVWGWLCVILWKKKLWHSITWHWKRIFEVCKIREVNCLPYFWNINLATTFWAFSRFSVIIGLPLFCMIRFNPQFAANEGIKNSNKQCVTSDNDVTIHTKLFNWILGHFRINCIMSKSHVLKLICTVINQLYLTYRILTCFLCFVTLQLN